MVRAKFSLTATSIVFSCPTRLISDVQLPLEMTAAIKTYPPLFVAFEAVMCAPSGDQLTQVQKSDTLGGRRTYLKRLKKVPGDSSNGFFTSASSSQSLVRHTFTDLSSEEVARNSPTGSQQTPFTNPWCSSSLRNRSKQKTR